MNYSRISNFIAHCASTVYAEPRSQGHDAITAQMFPAFSAKLMPHSTVLDVGCGKGPALDLFRDAGHRAIGITASPEDVADCVAAGHDCRQMDQHGMPKEWTGFFNAVWARHIAEHSPIPLFALKEYARVMKPGGLLYLEVPSPDTVANHPANPNHYSVFTAPAWACLLDKAGFEVTDCTTINIQLGIGPDAYFAFTCPKL